MLSYEKATKILTFVNSEDDDNHTSKVTARALSWNQDMGLSNIWTLPMTAINTCFDPVIVH